MRLIDADELKKCVLKWLPQDPCGREEKEMPFETDICVSMLMEIDEQPTAEPKKGKWIKISPANIYECSECGKSVMTNDICAYDFCHGCGAEMEK
mgnify:CR=1 FL=1